MIEEQKRPPIGVHPIFIFYESRLNDLNRAISEYALDNQDIPPLWLEERDIIRQLIKKEQSIRIANKL